MKIREVKELSTAEIQERIIANKELLNRTRLNHSISPLDNPMQIREIKKTIARLNTELRYREINQQ